MNRLLTINQFGCTRMGATFLFLRGPDPFEKYKNYGLRSNLKVWASQTSSVQTLCAAHAESMEPSWRPVRILWELEKELSIPTTPEFHSRPP